MSNILILKIEKLEQQIREMSDEILDLQSDIEILRSHSASVIDLESLTYAYDRADPRIPECFREDTRRLLKAHGIDV